MAISQLPKIRPAVSNHLCRKLRTVRQMAANIQNANAMPAAGNQGSWTLGSNKRIATATIAPTIIAAAGSTQLRVRSGRTKDRPAGMLMIGPVRKPPAIPPGINATAAMNESAKMNPSTSPAPKVANAATHALLPTKARAVPRPTSGRTRS